MTAQRFRCAPSPPFGERVGVRGIQNYRRPKPLTPPLSHPKSDLSDFGRLKVPNSGKPEFGGRGSRSSLLLVCDQALEGPAVSMRPYKQNARRKGRAPWLGKRQKRL